MAFGDDARNQAVLEGIGQFQKAERVADVGRTFAGAGRDFQISQAKLVHQSFERIGTIDGIKIGSLNILDDGHLQHPLGCGLNDFDRNMGETSETRGTPATFSGNDLITGWSLSNNERLDDAVGFDGID